MPSDLALALDQLKPRYAVENACRLRQSRVKRAIDILGSAFGLIFLLPLFILIALAIRLESPGPALFRQRRTGLDGRVFKILKFRSMRVSEDGDEIAHATQGDGRTTAVGRFLRKSCIDELPQLFNVLAGEMSLVGPRPHALAHDRYYGDILPTYVARFAAKPGITGLAQIRGFRGEIRRIEDMSSRVASDLDYIANWSPIADIKILLKTFILGPFNPSAY